MVDTPPEEGKNTRQGRRKPRKATPKSLENAALHHLNRYATSAENLRRLLLKRVRRSVRLHETDEAEGLEAVDTLIARLTTAGLLNDQGYAESRARSLHRRGASVSAIRAQLRQKGVSKADIDSALATLGEEGGDVALQAALAYARRRRIGPFRNAELRSANRERDLGALARQGHSPDVVLRVVDCRDLDELEQEAATEFR